MSIPKIIHYCWFGRNPKPKLAEKCMKSWKKYCKDYEIIEWNEDNFDISSAPLYVRQAYEAKKWAFVTDYVRLQVVYDHGGIYLDTDVEVIKPFDDLLLNRAFFGFEDGEHIATGLGFGAEKGTPILKELMKDYWNIPFIKEDGEFDILTCPVRNTEIFLRYGLRQDNSRQVLNGSISIFPTEYFCPKRGKTGKINATEKTYSIHHFSASWWDKEQNKSFKKTKMTMIRHKIIHFPNYILLKILGDNRYEQLKKFLKR